MSDIVVKNNETGEVETIFKSGMFEDVELSNTMSYEEAVIKVPKVVARIKLCGGGLTVTIMDNMQFEMPTPEQCENLKKTFGIEVELVEEE